MSFQLEQLMHKIAYATLVTDLSHVSCNWTRVDQDHLDITCPQCLQTYTAYAEGSKLTVVLCQLTKNFKTAINYRALLTKFTGGESSRRGSYTSNAKTTSSIHKL